jgi:quercetin dioxygenase-like cupin family protein
MKTYRVGFESLDWETQLPASRFKAFHHGETTLRVVEYAKGFVAPEWCTDGHVGYVLEGEMDIDFDGNVVRFAAGDGLFIPEGEVHRHKPTVVTDVVRVVLVEHA